MAVIYLKDKCVERRGRQVSGRLRRSNDGADADRDEIVNSRRSHEALEAVRSMS